MVHLLPIVFFLKKHPGPCSASSAAAHLSTTLFGTVEFALSSAALALARSPPQLAIHTLGYAKRMWRKSGFILTHASTPVATVGVTTARTASSRRAASST